MSSSIQETPISGEKELSLTKADVYLPLALAGSLGGVAHTGIQLIAPNRNDFDWIPRLQINAGYELLIYFLFSIVVSSILAPTVAIFSRGLPTKNNFNRLLTLSTLFGVFLTFTIGLGRNFYDVTQKNETATMAIETLQKQADKIDTTERQETKEIVIPENVELKKDAFYLSGKVSDDPKVKERNIEKLKELEEEVKSSDNDGNDDKEKQKLVDDINKKVSELEDK